MFDNRESQSGYTPKKSRKTDSLSIEAKMLLKALRDVVTPLVHLVDRENNDVDADQNALGSSGEQFVIALQKFISSFLGSRRGPMGNVEVALNENGEDIPNAASTNVTLHNDFNLKDVINLNTKSSCNNHPPAENIKSRKNIQSNEAKRKKYLHRRAVFNRDLIYSDTATYQRQLLLEKYMKTLREHVFNTMPIRLLFFKPHGSKLKIMLLERSEIYAHIASNLEKKFDFESAEMLQQEIFQREIHPVSWERAEQMAIDDVIHQYSKYATLSHTWLRGASGEITYGDWIRGDFDTQQPGYRKLMNFCKAAWKDHRVAFGWIDTVCINKESSAELDESIRSMYKWYRDTFVCITYLAETVTVSDIRNDSWFTRGWTLQELFAPSHIKFYNTHWNKLGHLTGSDKADSIILKEIEHATTIRASELTEPMWQIPISRKMQMGAKRQVTREEDSAYSLMGFVGVSISIAYGEGSERAFSRLLQELLINSSVNVLDIFNWAGPFNAHISGILPRTPHGYLHRSADAQLKLAKMLIEPIMLTHLGLRITVVLMLAISNPNPPKKYTPINNYHATVDISTIDSDSSTPVNRGNYSILDGRISRDARWEEVKNWSRLTFGVLNVTRDDDQKILVPKHCLAVGLRYIWNYTTFSTESPIVFTLDNQCSTNGLKPANYDDLHDSYSIKRTELESHGMKLATLYL